MVSLGLNPIEDENLQQQWAQQPATVQPDTPGVFEGIPTAVGRGFEQFDLKAANLAVAPFSPDDSQLLQDAIKSSQIDPQTTGFAGRMLGGFAEMAPAMASMAIPGVGAFGAAAIAGGPSGFAKYQEQAPVVGNKTAGELGLLEGGTQAAQMLIPGSVGESIAAKVASSAAINAGMASIGEGAQGSILRANGYNDMADQYKYFDAANIGAAALMGGFIGGIHGTLAKTPAERVENVENILPSTKDAAMYQANVSNIETDSAPGIPLNTETRNAHVDTMGPDNQARFVMGEDLDTSKVEANGDFLAKPEDTEAQAAYSQALKEAGYVTPEEEAQMAQRDAKLTEVQGKHQVATDAFNSVNDELTQAQSAIDQAAQFDPKQLTLGDKISMIDPDTGARLKQIESDLQQPNITTQQTQALQDEYKLVSEGSRISDKQIKSEVRDRVNENKANVADLTSKRDDVAARVDKAQKVVDRYRAEMNKRQAKLDSQRQKFLPINEQESAGEEPAETQGSEGENGSNPAGETEQPGAELNGGGNPAEGAGGETPDHDYQTNLAQQILAEKPGTIYPFTKEMEGEPALSPMTGEEAMQQEAQAQEQDKQTQSFIQQAIQCALRFGGME